MTTGRTQTDYCLTPEQEAEMDAAYREQEEHDWLVSWSDDFNSDEWLEALRDTIPMGSEREVA